MTKKPRKPRSGSVAGPTLARGDRVGAAYDRLRELIMSGRLAPGSRIIETDVAERLGVSRTPVRAALQRLLKDGFVVAADDSAQARLWVAPLSRADARELFAILAQCEALAAGWAAELPADDREPVVTRLGEINAAMARTGRSASPDNDALFAMDRDFHATFFEAGAGPRLRLLHDSVKPQAERYLMLYLNAMADRIEESVREHAAIVEAIGAADADAARAAVAANWSAAGQRLDQTMQRLGERGIW